MADDGTMRLDRDLRPLRILAFADCYTPEASGGAERVAHELYRRWAASGAAIHVISAAHGVPHDDPGVEVTPIPSIDLSGLAGGYLAPAPAAFTTGARLMRSFRPNVLHANTLHYTGCAAAAWLAARHKIPLLATAHLGPVDLLPGMMRAGADIYERVVSRYILGRASHILAVSESVRRHVISLGADSAKVAISHNGVDHARFSGHAMETRARTTIVCIGRLLPNKGPGLLLEAARNLAAQHIPFEVVFVGDGPLRAELLRRAREWRLEHRVRLVGHVKDPETWLARADIVVRASYSEGLSLAVIEAMAAGRCNVVSDIPPNRELIEDGTNGYLFRCGDANDLTRVLLVACADAETRRRIGARARDDSRRYTWDNMARIHAETMLDLLPPQE